MPRRGVANRIRVGLDAVWRIIIDDYVIDAEWSPDGSLLAAAAVSGPVACLNTENGELAWNVHAHGFGTTEVAWHPGLEMLTSAGQDGTVRHWDPADGTEIATLVGGDIWVEHVAWSPNGKILASSAGKQLRLWDPAGSLIRTFDRHQSTISDIAWAPEGGDIVTGSYGALQFWNVSSEKPVRTLEWQGSILTIAWSPDGRYIATGEQDSTVHFWTVKTGKDLQMWGFPTKVRELAWDVSGKYLATGGGPTVAVWNCAGRGPEGRKPILLDAHEEVLTALAFHPGMTLLASADEAGHLALWQPDVSNEPLDHLVVDGAISVLQWSPDGRSLIVATETGSIARIDVHSVA